MKRIYHLLGLNKKRLDLLSIGSAYVVAKKQELSFKNSIGRTYAELIRNKYFI